MHVYFKCSIILMANTISFILQDLFTETLSYKNDQCIAGLIIKGYIGK